MAEPDDRRDSEIARLRKDVSRLRRALARARALPTMDQLLRRRGFRVHTKEPEKDLLLPPAAEQDEYYRRCRKYSFRLFLRDVIRLQKGFTIEQIARYSTPRVSRSYAEYLSSIGLLDRRADRYHLARRGLSSFGPTLEWFVAEVFRREFGCETLRSVKFRQSKAGGDYDVLARLGEHLVYCEVKSSPPKQICDSEVDAFLDRVRDLAPTIALFLMDTELRMKDKLVPLFEAAITRQSAGPPRVERLERELFHIGGRMFIVNAKESIQRNLERVIAWHEGGRRAICGD